MHQELAEGKRKRSYSEEDYGAHLPGPCSIFNSPMPVLLSPKCGSLPFVHHLSDAGDCECVSRDGGAEPTASLVREQIAVLAPAAPLGAGGSRARWQIVGGRRSGAGRQVRGTVAAREAKKRRPPRARLRPAGKGLPAAAPGQHPARRRAELSRTSCVRRGARPSSLPWCQDPHAQGSSCLRRHLIGAAGSIFQSVKLRMRKSRGPGSCARRTPAPSAFRFPGCGWSPSRAPASAGRRAFTCACRPVPLPTAFSSGRASSTACVPCPPRPEPPSHSAGGGEAARRLSESPRAAEKDASPLRLRRVSQRGPAARQWFSEVRAGRPAGWDQGGRHLPAPAEVPKGGEPSAGGLSL
ncbi:uncharacterized protein LOC134807531 [Pan troglodytes]|uniref:uncharacterized protein LOC134807531 n=1 Tax=Pan troglodytes TaxID=9598 RepID=UPI00301393F4